MKDKEKVDIKIILPAARRPQIEQLRRALGARSWKDAVLESLDIAEETLKEKK